MSTVIKVGRNDGSAGGIAYDLTDMADQAKVYLEEIRGQAREIVAAAQKEAVQIRVKAKEEGLRDAERLIEQQLEVALSTLTPALKKTIEEIEKAKRAWILHWENAAVGLATAIAERIIQRELENRPELPLDFVRSALDLAAGKGRVVVRMNPNDYQTLKPKAEMVLDEFRRQNQEVELVVDAAIAPGGCRVDTEFGGIDQQVQSQLERIREELVG